MSLTDRDGGVVVGSIFVHGPAHQSGITVDDLLVSVAGHPVKSVGDVRDIMQRTVVGSHVSVVVLQHQGRLKRDVVLRVMTADPSFAHVPEVFYNLEGHTKISSAAPPAAVEPRKVPQTLPRLPSAGPPLVPKKSAPEVMSKKVPVVDAPPSSAKPAEVKRPPSSQPVSQPVAAPVAAPVTASAAAPPAVAAPVPAIPAAAPSIPVVPAPKVTARDSDSDSSDEDGAHKSSKQVSADILEIQMLKAKKSNRDLAKERTRALLIDDD